ncbi:ribbon-helix-helix protein, CopG family [Sulfitobacter sp. 1A13496]
MPTELLAALDEARRVDEDLPSRPELIRRIIEDWAARRRRES